MKFNLLLCALLILLTVKTDASAADNARSFTHTVLPFRILTIEDHLNVIIREGTAPSVTVEGESKKINAVSVVQQGDQLVLSKKGIVLKDENVVIYVTVQHLRILEIKGDAHVQSANELGGDLLWVKNAGNGEIDLKTTAQKVLTTSWANGTIRIRGNYQSCSTYRSESGRLVTAYSKNVSTVDAAPKN